MQIFKIHNAKYLEAKVNAIRAMYKRNGLIYSQYVNPVILNMREMGQQYKRILTTGEGGYALSKI